MSLSRAEEPLPARTLLAGRYELLELVGRGGMAEVHRAHDRALDRVVAVKLLPHAHRDDSEQAVRLREEARAAAALHHPHAVSVFDVGGSDHGLFVVMEFAAGRTLREEISERGRLGEGEAAAVALAVCEALAASHARGIVHRDVKPANIIVADDGGVKLTDFGIARVLAAEGVTAPGVIVGTATYMAPEQVRGDRLDGRADLYALGVVLYELVTGSVPFTGVGSADVAARRLHESPVPPRHLVPALSREMDDLVLRALALDPAGRHREAREMAEDLRALASGSPGNGTGPDAVPESGATATVPAPRTGDATRSLAAVDRFDTADREAPTTVGPPDPGERDPWARVRVAGIVLAALAAIVLVVAVAALLLGA